MITTILRRCALVSAALFGLCVGANTADAGLILSTGPDNNGTDNVLFNQKVTGNPVSGEIDHSGVLAIFSTTQSPGLIAEESQGQARVSVAEDSLMTNISVTTSIGSYNKIVFNPFGDGLQNIGTASLTVFTNDGLNGTVFSPPSFVVGNGNNFYTLEATGSTLITSIKIDIATAAGETGFIDLRQIRIGGPDIVSTAPEPATLTVALTGIGALGLASLRRRFRRPQVEG
jgi:hypothetical protein